MDFNLSQLIERWLYILMPTIQVFRLVDNVRKRKTITLMERWDEVQILLNTDTPQIKKHKEKLFGHDSNIETGGLFSEISLCKRDGMPTYHDFIKLPIGIRAKYIAFATLDSMKEIIERHDSLLKENLSKSLSKNKGKKRGRRRR